MPGLEAGPRPQSTIDLHALGVYNPQELAPRSPSSDRVSNLNPSPLADKLKLRSLNPEIFSQTFVKTKSSLPAEPHFIPSPVENIANVDMVAKNTERPTEDSGIGSWVKYFDTNWEEEGLTEDWHNLKSQVTRNRVGFVMSRQMDSFDPTDRENVLDWTKRTERDLAGFKLEFLSDHIVYPRKYYQSESDPTRLEDPLYGKSKVKEGAYADIVEIISEEERNGSVKRAMGEVKDFLLSAPEGSMTVMTSPLGPTDFKTDDGVGIDYPESYFFIDVKDKEGEVTNYTIKTNFSLKECRTAISRLTGIKLHEGASLEEYVAAVAKINPEKSSVKNIFDIINIFEDVHPDAPFVDDQNGKITTWDDVKNDITEGEKLYNFDKRTKNILEKFVEFGEEDVPHSKEEYQKAAAAAILLFGKEFFTEKEAQKYLSKEILLEPNTWSILAREAQKFSFGKILEKTSERRGCSGGGKKTTITTAGGERSANVGGEKKCSDCGKDSTDNHYHCPGCNTRYSDETQVSADNRTKSCACGVKFGC